jgi:hypothetical protein
MAVVNDDVDLLAEGALAVDHEAFPAFVAAPQIMVEHVVPDLFARISFFSWVPKFSGGRQFVFDLVVKIGEANGK